MKECYKTLGVSVPEIPTTIRVSGKSYYNIPKITFDKTPHIRKFDGSQQYCSWSTQCSQMDQRWI